MVWMIQWLNGTMASLMARWYDGTRHDGTWLNVMMAILNKGLLVQCDGNMMHGLMVRLLDGTMSQCLIASSMV